MRRAIVSSLLAVPCIAALLCVSPATAGALGATAAPATTSGIDVSWTFYETPGQPVARPEWIGYDVMRRSPGDCGTLVRLNTDPLPRVVGQTHSGSWHDATAGAGVAWEYRVWPVDVNHQLVLLGPLECDPPCAPPSVTSWPALSAPLVIGTVVEWGWAVEIQPCANTCWTGAYVENPAAAVLRPYVGTAQAVRIYGTSVCGTMEGCAVQLDHFELDACGSTPTHRTSWGALKSIYR